MAGGRGSGAGAILRIQEWPVSVPTIFIPISEKKLSEADDIAVRVLVAVNRYLSCLLPIDLGLAYSVDKSKRLTTVHVGRRQTGELLEGGIPGGTLDGQFPIFQKTWLGKQTTRAACGSGPAALRFIFSRSIF